MKIFLAVISIIGFAMNANCMDFSSFYFKHNTVKHYSQVTVTGRFGWKTVSTYDSVGALVNEKSFYEKRLRADISYRYEEADSTLAVYSHDNVDAMRPIPVIRFCYDNQGRCVRIEQQCGETPSVYTCICDNFVWNGNVLLEKRFMAQGRATVIYKYINDDNGRAVSCKTYDSDQLECGSIRTYTYDKKGNMTDETLEYTDPNALITDVETWSDKARNKYHIRYGDFQKDSMWTRSWFVTEKGEKWYCKRKIK